MADITAAGIVRQAADAWHCLAEDWFVRRDKSRPAGKEWQVVHSREETMIVVAEFATQEDASDCSSNLDSEARAKNALATLPVTVEQMASIPPDVLSWVSAHPEAAKGLAGGERAAVSVVPRPLDDWHEDIGPVLWWFFPIQEPPWAGTPLDSDWANYYTHFTPCPMPSTPAPSDEAQGETT